MDNYDKIKTIGSGSFGSVYLVNCLKTNRLFAMKQVKLDERKKYQNYESVVNESRILSQLKHPNIVEYQDSFFDNSIGILYIIQDYCDGGTLDEKIKAYSSIHKFIEEKNVMKWFVQILMAIQYIHSMKILHRDIKPQNVFLSKNENVCKLGDFGISKSMSSTVDVSQTCIGTPYYMSPEMCEDIPYSSKADIWALGCLLHETCSQHPAFESNNLLGIITKIINAKYDPLPSVYSNDLSTIVSLLIKKNPDDRPSACQILIMPFIKSCLDNLISDSRSEKNTELEKQGADKEDVVYEDDFESDGSSDENYEEDFEEYVSDKELDEVVVEARRLQKNSWSHHNDATIFDQDDDGRPMIKDLLKPYKRIIADENVYLIEDLLI